jgi:hypothetical protein
MSHSLPLVHRLLARHDRGVDNLRRPLSSQFSIDFFQRLDLLFAVFH